VRSEDKPIRWTLHAFARANRRGIDLNDVQHTVEAPEFVVTSDADRRIYMRRYNDRETGKAMLVRLVIEETVFERVIISVLITSKVSKYLPEDRP
jgi:hypothetical protein